MYTANIHAIYRQGSDAGVNLFLNQLGKVFQVNQVGTLSLEMCAIRLN